MHHWYRRFFLMVGLALICTRVIYADHDSNAQTTPSIHVSEALWGEVTEFLLPNEHPVKGQLDEIFLTSRAIINRQSMVEAGFDDAKPQHHTRIIVTRHPKLKGYIIKAYLDDEDYHSGHPEQYFWIKRATGARLIQNSIRAHQYEHLFKVPKKWIYLLPDEPSPPRDYLRKIFILVEEDMDLLDEKQNMAKWGSDEVTKELLKALYTITTELGLFDCTKLDNCPFSKDGRVAFIDTQSYHKSYVKYHKLTPHLNPSMRSYWKKLIKNKVQ